jgi:hypothetical protein
MNLIEKLFEIQKSCQYVQKNAQGYQYKYASGTDVLAPIRAKMDELRVMLFPNVTDAKTERGEMVADGGKTKIQFFTEIRLNFVWVDVDNFADQIVVPFYAQGVDPGEKGVGKAWTYAERYFLLKFFHIPTDQDDPDRFQERQQAATRPRRGAAAPQQPTPVREPAKALQNGQGVPSNPWIGKLISISAPTTGTKNGKQWTRWEIETADFKLSTFDGVVAQVALKALRENKRVHMVWKLKRSTSGVELCTAESMSIEGFRVTSPEAWKKEVYKSDVNGLRDRLDEYHDTQNEELQTDDCLEALHDRAKQLGLESLDALIEDERDEAMGDHVLPDGLQYGSKG